MFSLLILKVEESTEMIFKEKLFFTEEGNDWIENVMQMSC